LSPFPTVPILFGPEFPGSDRFVSDVSLLCRKPLRMIELEELGWGPGREESP
jgi:hypothetical protein